MWPIASARRGPSRNVGWAFSQTVEPGRRVAAVGDREVAPETRHPPLVEDRADHPEVLVEHQLLAVADRDPGRLLAAVLEREQPERGDRRRLGAAAGRDDRPEHAAHPQPSLPAERPRQPGVPGVAELRQTDVERVRDAAAALLRGAGRAGARRDRRPAARRRRCPAPRPEAVLPREQRQRRGVARPARDDEPRGALAEQVDRRRVRDRQPERRAEPRSSSPRSPPPRPRPRGRRPTRPGRSRAGRAPPPRGRTPGSRASVARSSAGRSVLGRDPGERRVVAAREARASPRRRAARRRRRRERRPDPQRDVLEQPDDADLGRRRDPAGRRLVVERDVAAGDRQSERPARVAQAADGLAQLPERVGLRRVAVVQAVRDAERPRAGDRDVAGRLRDAQRRAQPRVQRADGLVRVGRGDERLASCP